MREEEVKKYSFNKPAFIFGIILILVAILFLFCSFFLAEKLSAYFGITFVIGAVGGAVLSVSGCFGDKIPGIIISCSLFISGMFLFCFSLVTDGTENAFVTVTDVSQYELSTSNNTGGVLSEYVTSDSGAFVEDDVDVSPEQEPESSSYSSNGGSSYSNSNSNSSNSSSIVSKSESSTVSSKVSSTVSQNKIYLSSQDTYLKSSGDLDIEILSELKFKRGNTATVSVKGKPNTVYSIEVYYSSGKSSAAGLGDSKSNDSGEVSWTFKVGARTAPGEYKLLISDGTDSSEFKFTVE